MAKVGTSNVKVQEIGSILNAAGGSVNINQPLTFFTAAANINKWALHKPEKHTNLVSLTDDERYNNNCGFDVSRVQQAVSGLFSDASSGNIWNYILPTGDSSFPYRLADFCGYNTDAITPYGYQHIGTSGSSTSGSYSVDWRVLKNEGAEIDMSKLDICNTLNAKYYLFVCRKASGSAYDYIKSSIVSTSGDPSDIQCSITIPSTGTWECIFCMGQSSTEDIESRTDLVVMPGGYFTFSLSKEVIYVDCTYTSPNLNDYASYDSGTMYLNLGTQYFYITLKANSSSVPSTELRFGFEMELLDGDGNSLSDTRYIYSDDDNDTKEYSGTDTVEWQTVNFPQAHYLPNYFSEADIYNAAKIRLRPNVTVVSGNGFARMTSDTYYDISM